MKKATINADKKFFLVVSVLVLISVLLSSSYSFAIEEATVPTSVPTRAEASDIQIDPEPIVVKEEKTLVTSEDVNLRYSTTPLKSKTTLTAEELNKSFKGTGMEGLGPAFKEAERIYGINAAGLAALAIHESAWGNSYYARQRNNLFGFQAYTANPNAAKDFETQKEGILYVASFLNVHYLSEDGKYFQGGTLADINPIYAADKTWKTDIASIWSRLENGTYDE